MQILKLALTFCLMMQFGFFLLAGAVDLTGTWESKYSFMGIDEVMTANIQQVGENILGSFTVQPSTGEKYSGIIFGTAVGDSVKANYLSVAPKLIITFADCRVTDTNTLSGTSYVQDSDMNAIPGIPFEAIRK
jgi:hypothetical protein